MPSGTSSRGARTSMERDPLADAKKAQEHARIGFLSAVEQGIEVRRVTDKLKQHHERNHYGILLERAMMRKPK